MFKYSLRSMMAVSLVAGALVIALPARAEDKPADAKPAKEEPKKHQITGVIASIDTKTNLLKITKGTNTVELSCASHCSVSTEAKKNAEFTDLKVGDKVTCTYEDVHGKNMCHKVMPPKPAKKADDSKMEDDSKKDEKPSQPSK